MSLFTSRLSHLIRKRPKKTKQVLSGWNDLGRLLVKLLFVVGALFLTWSFTTIARLYEIATGHNSTILLLLMAIFFPFQGFFVFIVYCRPRYVRCKSRNPNLSARELLWLTLFPQEQDHNTNWLPGDTLAAVGRGDNNQGGSNKRRSITASFYSVGNNIGRC